MVCIVNAKTACRPLGFQVFRLGIIFQRSDSVDVSLTPGVGGDGKRSEVGWLPRDMGNQL